jgi:antitoxin MazE
MRTHVARWGNSLAVRLPRQIAESVGLGEGTTVDVDVVDGEVRLVPARPVYSLDELLAGITKDNLPESFDDRPHGLEAL